MLNVNHKFSLNTPIVAIKFNCSYRFAFQTLFDCHLVTDCVWTLVRVVGIQTWHHLASLGWCLYCYLLANLTALTWYGDIFSQWNSFTLIPSQWRQRKWTFFPRVFGSGQLFPVSKIFNFTSHQNVHKAFRKKSEWVVLGTGGREGAKPWI